MNLISNLQYVFCKSVECWGDELFFVSLVYCYLFVVGQNLEISNLALLVPIHKKAHNYVVSLLRAEAAMNANNTVEGCILRKQKIFSFIN